MLWVLKRNISMRRFFWAPKTHVKTDGKDNIYKFTLKFFVYLNLWVPVLRSIIYLFHLIGHLGNLIFKLLQEHTNRSKVKYA